MWFVYISTYVLVWLYLFCAAAREHVTHGTILSLFLTFLFPFLFICLFFFLFFSCSSSYSHPLPLLLLLCRFLFLLFLVNIYSISILFTRTSSGDFRVQSFRRSYSFLVFVLRFFNLLLHKNVEVFWFLTDVNNKTAKNWSPVSRTAGFCRQRR